MRLGRRSASSTALYRLQRLVHGLVSSTAPCPQPGIDYSASSTALYTRGGAPRLQRPRHRHESCGVYLVYSILRMNQRREREREREGLPRVQHPRHESCPAPQRRRDLRYSSHSLPAYVSIRQHTSPYVSIRQHMARSEMFFVFTTCAYVSIREHT